MTLLRMLGLLQETNKTPDVLPSNVAGSGLLFLSPISTGSFLCSGLKAVLSFFLKYWAQALSDLCSLMASVSMTPSKVTIISTTIISADRVPFH